MNPIQLAEQGWHLVPWTNRKSASRQPIIQGFLKNKPSVKTVTEWVAKYPECDWAVVPVDHVVLDIEMKNGLDGEAELTALEFANSALPVGPITSTFNGGRHLWLRLPDGCELKGGVHITPGIEIKCKTGTVHVPPSEGYTAVRPLSTDCPIAPPWLIDLWCAAKPAGRVLSTGEKFAMGERHAGLCSMAGKFRNLGLGEEAIFYALTGARIEKCEDPDSVTDEELRGIAKTYGQKDADSYELRVERKEEEAMAVEKFFSQPVTLVARAEPTDKTIPVLDGALLRPTPMIAAWVDWILENSDRHQPELSLLSVCVAIGGLIGRDVVWNRTHANLYGLGLATSGSGKNTPLHSIEVMYDAAGYIDLLGASRIGSDAGMLQAINKTPNILWPLDEISILLKNFGKGATPAYIDGIKQYLLEWHSCSPHRGVDLKGVEKMEISAPYPNLMAFAQPTTFTNSVNDESIESGLIGRFTVFLGEHLPRKNMHTIKSPPPMVIVTALRALRAPGAVSVAAEQTMAAASPVAKTPQEVHATPQVVAHRIKCDNAIEDELEELKKQGGLRSTLHARTMEKANKFALIYAWSENPAFPVMTEKAIDWGIAVAKYSNDCILNVLANRTINLNAEATEFCYSCIEVRGFSGMTPGKLIAIAQHVERNKRESIMKDLIESGRIYEVKTKMVRGTITRRYVADRHMPQDQLI